MKRVKYTKIAEAHVDDFFDDVDSTEEQFCEANCIFEHRTAREYILYLGPSHPSQDGAGHVTNDRVTDLIADMREAGCREEFIEIVREAANEGAERIIFWID